MDDARLVADLAPLVQAAGLGPANRVARNAGTLHNLRHSLEAQAEFVRKLHPSLISSDAVALLLKAGARKWKN